MSELAGSAFGDPEQIWVDSAASAPSAERTPADDPPDLSDKSEFFSHVVLYRSRVGVPLVLLFFAIILIAAPFLFAGVELEPVWALPTVCWTLAPIGILIAVIYFVRHSPSAQQALAEEAYEQFRSAGVLGRVVPTDLVLNNEADGSQTVAALVIDVNCSPTRSLRLEVAFERWLAVLQSDSELRHRMIGWLTTLDEPVASERIFGADAEGGYLIPRQIYAAWAIIVPDAGAPVESWDMAKRRSIPVH